MDPSAHRREGGKSSRVLLYQGMYLYPSHQTMITLHKNKNETVVLPKCPISRILKTVFGLTGGKTFWANLNPSQFSRVEAAPVLPPREKRPPAGTNFTDSNSGLLKKRNVMYGDATLRRKRDAKRDSTYRRVTSEPTNSIPRRACTQRQKYRRMHRLV